MRFGLYLLNDFPPDVVPASRLGDVERQVDIAVEAGFHSIWALQHLVSNMPTLQPVPLLSYLAPRSGDLLLGTCILILPLHNPVIVAEELATLEHLSGGRVIAGLGLGYRDLEFEALGIDPSQRIPRFVESVQILRKLWNGPTTFRGAHFDLPTEVASVAPVQAGGPPIWVGAGAHPAGARRAATFGDGWILTPTVPLDRLQGMIAEYRSIRRHIGGADEGQVAVIRELLLRPDEEEALRIGVASRDPKARLYAQYNTPDRTRTYRHLWSDGSYADIAGTISLMTTPAECIRRLRQLETLGVDVVILRAQWFNLPAAVAEESLLTFVTEVLPHFSVITDRS